MRRLWAAFLLAAVAAVLLGTSIKGGNAGLVSVGPFVTQSTPTENNCVDVASDTGVGTSCGNWHRANMPFLYDTPPIVHDIVCAIENSGIVDADIDTLAIRFYYVADGGDQGAGTLLGTITVSDVAPADSDIGITTQAVDTTITVSSGTWKAEFGAVTDANASGSVFQGACSLMVSGG